MIRALLTRASYAKRTESWQTPARFFANVVSKTLHADCASDGSAARLCNAAVHSDDAVLSQLLHVLGADAAQRAEQGIGVLAQQRRAAHRHGRVGELDRAADGAIGAACRMLDVDDHLAR